MEAYDFEVDQPVPTGSVAKAAARLGGVATWALENLTGQSWYPLS